MLWDPLPSTNEFGFVAALIRVVELLSTHVMFVTPDGSAADTCTSTPSIPLVEMLYQPVPATESAASVVIVTTGAVESEFHWTELSVLVEPEFPLPTASAATPAGTVTTTLPVVVIPVTATLNVVPDPGVTVPTSVPPAVLPTNDTSPVAKLVTVSLKTTVKLMGATP